MIRGNNRQVIFFNTICFDYFLNLVAESAKKFDHKLLCFCLMSNHAHLLVHIHNDSLSAVMQNINHRYARWFNHKNNRIGHLFQGRYRSIAVNNEDYLVNLCRYIHFNPVEAKIVSHPADYLWSSHQYYLSNAPPDWMDINLTLSVINCKTSLGYKDFINKPVDRQQWKPGLYFSPTGELIIDQDVVRDLHSTLNQIDQKIKRRSLDPDFVSRLICWHLNVEFYQLAEESLSRKISQGRAVLVDAWHTYSSLTMTEIARRLSRTRGTLDRQQMRFSNAENPFFSKEFLVKIKHSLEIAQVLQE